MLYNRPPKKIRGDNYQRQRGTSRNKKRVVLQIAASRNLYAPNYRAAEGAKQTLTETGKLTIRLETSTSLSQQLTKNQGENQQTSIQTRLFINLQDLIHFQNIPLRRLLYMHSQNIYQDRPYPGLLNTSQQIKEKIEVTQSVFYDHSVIKVEINNK